MDSAHQTEFHSQQSHSNRSPAWPYLLHTEKQWFCTERQSMDPALILQGIFLQHSSLIEVNLGATIPPRLAFLPLGSCTWLGCSRQGLNYQGYNSWLGTPNSGEALAELSSLIHLHVNMIILNELQTRLNCKNISSFCSIFKCSAPSCFHYSKNLAFLQLTKNIFRINDAQHPQL